EAETGAGGAVPGAVEALEGAGGVGGRHAGAVVGHLDDAGPETNGRRRPGRRVGADVRQEIGEDLPHVRFVHRGDQRVRGVEGERAVRVRGGGVGDGGAGQGDEVGGGGLQGRLAVRAGQGGVGRGAALRAAR